MTRVRAHYGHGFADCTGSAAAPMSECMSPGAVYKDLRLRCPKFVLVDCLTKSTSFPELTDGNSYVSSTAY